MKAFRITEIREFMSKLLVHSVFDSYRLLELSLTTNVVHTIDGQQNLAYYDSDEAEQRKASPETYIAWREIRPLCYSMIKGKQTPLRFKIVLMQERPLIRELVEKNKLAVNPDDIFGLYLNCQFDGDTLLCTTGTSLRIFSTDKTIEFLWDETVASFFKLHQISFEAV